MPLLREVFDLADCYGARKLRFNVETKVEAGAPHETAPRDQFVQLIAAEVARRGCSTASRSRASTGAR